MNRGIKALVIIVAILAVLAIAGYGFSMRSILTTLAINLVYGLSSRRINMMSHAGGFVGGAAIMAVVLAVV